MIKSKQRTLNPTTDIVASSYKPSSSKYPQTKYIARNKNMAVSLPQLEKLQTAEKSPQHKTIVEGSDSRNANTEMDEYTNSQDHGSFELAKKKKRIKSKNKKAKKQSSKSQVKEPFNLHDSKLPLDPYYQQINEGLQFSPKNKFNYKEYYERITDSEKYLLNLKEIIKTGTLKQIKNEKKKKRKRNMSARRSLNNRNGNTLPGTKLKKLQPEPNSIGGEKKFRTIDPIQETNNESEGQTYGPNSYKWAGADNRSQTSLTSHAQIPLRAPNLQNIDYVKSAENLNLKPAFRYSRNKSETYSRNGGSRRVHQEGLLMLENHYSLKESELKSNQMENRIKRLEYEDHRGLQKQEAAERKAEQILAARNRHHEDLMSKFAHWEKQSNDLKQKKIFNYIEATRRKNNAENSKMKIMDEKRDVGSNMKQIKDILNQAKNINDLERMGQNKMKWRQIMNSKLGMQNEQMQGKLDSMTALNMQYHNKMKGKQELSQTNIDRMSMMERREELLISKLKETQAKTRKAQDQVDLAVNMGRKYYQEVQHLKAKKLDRLLPSISRANIRPQSSNYKSHGTLFENQSQRDQNFDQTSLYSKKSKRSSPTKSTDPKRKKGSRTKLKHLRLIN